MAHRALMGLTRNLPKQTKKIEPLLENLLVLDFEATCIKNNILEPQEIIEFPCLAVSVEDYTVQDVFHKYVKPKVHPKLSDFCIELTGIMQETVENEQYFPQVFLSFCEWLEEGKYFDRPGKSAFVACGDWDFKVMLPSQCELENIRVPNYFNEWINLKTSFYATTKYYPCSLSDMLSYLKMDFQGKVHSGIDDVHNMVRIMNKLNVKYKANLTINAKINEIHKEEEIV